MSGSLDDRRVIFEFISVGHYVKVSAVDPQTLTEVSIVGDPAAGRETLQRNALRKLRYVIEKNQNQKR